MLFDVGKDLLFAFEFTDDFGFHQFRAEGALKAALEEELVEGNEHESS